MHLQKATEDAVQALGRITPDSTFEEFQVAMWRVHYLYVFAMKLQKDLEKSSKRGAQPSAAQRDRYEVSA